MSLLTEDVRSRLVGIYTGPHRHYHELRHIKVPNGFVVEYTAEVQQVDDTYVPHDAKWWHDQNIWPCRWMPLKTWWRLQPSEPVLPRRKASASTLDPAPTTPMMTSMTTNHRPTPMDRESMAIEATGSVTPSPRRLRPAGHRS